MFVYIAASKIHGNGLFTSIAIKKGTDVTYVGNEKERSGPGDDSWIAHWAKFVNHRKKANCVLTKTGTHFMLTAIKKIPAYEELTCDYTKIPSPPFNNTVTNFVEL